MKRILVIEDDVSNMKPYLGLDSETDLNIVYLNGESVPAELPGMFPKARLFAATDTGVVRHHFRQPYSCIFLGDLGGRYKEVVERADESFDTLCDSEVVLVSDNPEYRNEAMKRENRVSTISREAILLNGTVRFFCEL